MYAHTYTESDWYCTVFMYTLRQHAHEGLTEANSSAFGTAEQNRTHNTQCHALAIISYEHLSVSGFEVLVINSGVDVALVAEKLNSSSGEQDIKKYSH